VSGRFTALLAIIAAVFVALQVGLVHSRRSEASALRQRLGDVQARCAGSELALRKDLQAQRVRADWLQANLERSSGESERLRSELAAARKALELVELSGGAAPAPDGLPGAADGAPGALHVELVPSADLAHFAARAANASGAAVEVLEVSGLLWLGGRADGSGYSAQGTRLAAGDELELFDYGLFGGEPQSVREGSETLRAALCFVWLPAEDSGEWLGTWWFEYQPESGEMLLVRRDAAPLAVGSTRGCDLQAAAPPW
jgi:hypothetical protein